MKVTILCMVAACSALLANVASASSFPQKSVKIVVPFSAGGSGDVVARLLGKHLGERWGRQVVIENIPGAAGQIGRSAVVRSEPDGYTLLLADESVLVIAPQMQGGKDVQPLEGMRPITPVANIDFVLSVSSSSGIRNMKAFVEQGKKEKRLSYGSAGVGSIHNLIMEHLADLLGLSLMHVPYKGTAQVFTDVVSNEVTAVYSGIPQARSFIDAGKIVPLAIGSAQAHPALPGVPTISSELGMDFDGTAVWYITAPQKTPDSVISQIHSDIRSILDDPAYRDAIHSAGLSPADSKTDAKAELLSKWTRWRSVIDARGLWPQGAAK